LNHRFIDSGLYEYYVSFDLISYIRYLSLYVLLDKLYLAETIKLYLFEFLNLGVFIDLIFYLDFSSTFTLLYKNSFNIMYKLLQIFIFQLSYEISIMLGSFYFSRYSLSKIIFINSGFSLLLFSKDYKKIRRIRKNVLNILFFNGIYIQKKPEIKSVYLLNGINLNLLFISTNYKVYPFYFIIRPSLYSQFLLIKQLSALLIESVSKPIFLLVIRLNMLLILWSMNYIVESIKRILYLIDYLIDLKLRLFIKKKKLNLHTCNIIVYRIDEFSGYYKYVIKMSNKFIFVFLRNDRYVNYYIVLKLFWLCQ